MYNRLKDILRRVLYLLFNFRHIQGAKKNIVLFSTRRGGSTWLSQVISSGETNLRYYDHIFSWYQTDFYSRKFFNVYKNNQEIYATTNNIDYFELVNSGRHIARTVVDPFSKDFVRKSTRLLYKVTEGKGLFDWFVKNRSIEVVYQVRHPIPTALSVMRLGWDLTIDAYLNNDKFIDEYLKGDKFDYCIRINDGNDMLSKYVLNWVLENLIPLNSKNLSSTLIISYEETIMNPEKIINLLNEKLDLESTQLMIKTLIVPSRSSSLSESTTINKMFDRDVESLLSRWKKEINNKRERELMGILEKFDIDLYSYNDLLLNSRYIIRT